MAKSFEQLEKELKFLDKFKDRHLLILIDFDENFSQDMTNFEIDTFTIPK